MPEKHIAIYARQSIDKDGSLSIDGQVDLCRNLAGSGADVRMYIDRGFSGKNMSRPELKRLISDIERGEIEKIICYRLDRISRSIMDFGGIWKICDNNKTQFVSVNENFDTSTPFGRAAIYIIMVFAQLERETTAERVTDNYYQRIKSGAWPGGPAPFGFDIKKDVAMGGAFLVPNDNIKTAVDMFNSYAQYGVSLGSLAKQLNSEKRYTQNNKYWTNNSVARTLHNPAYVKATAAVYAFYTQKGAVSLSDVDSFTGERGIILVGKRTANERKYTDINEHKFALALHDGVIDAATFLLCQNKLDSNKQIKNTGKGKLSWLSGLLKCGECGYAIKLMREAGHDRIYCVCSGRTNYRVCLHKHSERIEDVEHFVAREISAVIKAQGSEVPTKQNATAKNDMENDIKKIEIKISNLVGSLSEAASVTMKYVNAEIVRLENEKVALSKKIALTATPNIKLADVTASQFEAQDMEQKKEIAALLIESVHITTDRIDIKWRI